MQLRFSFSLVCLCVSVAAAQTYPKGELFAGYSFTTIDQNSGPRANANGFEVSASGNFNRWLAVEFDASGYYQQLRDNGGPAGTFSYIAGPRFNIFRTQHSVSPFFFHFLLGFQHLIGSDFGASVSDTAITAALGGGVEWQFSNHLAIRSSIDYAPTHYVVGQNNIRTSIGLAYSFGRVARR